MIEIYNNYGIRIERVTNIKEDSHPPTASTCPAGTRP